ncbi:response regulator [Oleiphilus messinensis]|uniref:Response regulator n=1 Tax=Oleiphilus messinensis TaxID=141451 RepID=A0A1Y0IG35_9GAMM|nr:response regulator [Oleiphilus messinensis]ARU59441.1 response regulator [Oleiphilus messinensis]
MTLIHIIDDNDGFRDSLFWLLQANQFTVHTYASAEEFIDTLGNTEIKSLVQSCVLTDVRMPGISGLELMDHLRDLKLGVPVIVMTGHGDIPLAVEAMRKGAYSFMEKPFEASVLINSIKGALEEPGTELRNPLRAKAKLDQLSPRERQVLELVCAGQPNKVIATTLGISVKTVELHRSRMFNKLQTKNIQDLIRLTLGYE